MTGVCNESLKSSSLCTRSPKFSYAFFLVLSKINRIQNKSIFHIVCVLCIFIMYIRGCVNRKFSIIDGIFFSIDGKI